MEKTDLHDELLRNLLKSAYNEKPGPAFTDRIMRVIEQPEVKIAFNPWWSWQARLLILFGTVTLLIFYFVLFPLLNISVLELSNPNANPVNYRYYLDMFLNTINGLGSFLDVVRQSPLALVIVFVVPALVIIDRVFRGVASRSFMFVF